MSQQLALFETPEPVPAKYGVFLAVFPDSLTAHHVSKLATRIRENYGLHGRVRPLNHLHVSLCPLGGCSDLSEKIIHFVGRICATVVAHNPPFEVRFDRVTSFRGGHANCPLVLINRSDGNTTLMRLYQALDAEFSRHRRRNSGSSKFNPHITLLYDEQSIPEEPVEPVSWTVDEIVLVFSEVGATKYECLGRWKLGS